MQSLEKQAAALIPELVKKMGLMDKKLTAILKAINEKKKK